MTATVDPTAPDSLLDGAVGRRRSRRGSVDEPLEEDAAASRVRLRRWLEEEEEETTAAPPPESGDVEVAVDPDADWPPDADLETTTTPTLADRGPREEAPEVSVSEPEAVDVESTSGTEDRQGRF